MPSEPIPTALLLSGFGALMIISVLFARASERFWVPVSLIFLLIGMAAGSEGLGRLAFENYAMTFRVGTVALALILFDGGLNTSLAAVRASARPAGALATIGVVGTAGLVAVAAHALGFSWLEGLLLGAIVSPTDAAAVFAVLRGSGISLKRRLGVTLELESGLNDPVAVILTVAVTGALVEHHPLGWGLAVQAIVELVLGAIVGVLAGVAGRVILRRARLPAAGLYPVLTVALACLAFGVATLVGGSGFLAVYLTGVVVADGSIPHRTGVLRVHDALGWFSQVFMFVLLGLLAFPSRLVAVAPIGLALALFLAVVARPAIVMLCLLPFRFPVREALYVSWVGLRGAVPVILATFPVMAGADGSLRIFDIVFFVVVTSLIIPGATVAWVTRRLSLESSEPPRPQAVLELTASQPLGAEILSFYIEPEAAVAGARIADLPFPEGAAAALIARGGEILAPRGDTVLHPGDHVFVFCRRADRPFLQLVFGRLEETEQEEAEPGAGAA